MQEPRRRARCGTECAAFATSRLGPAFTVGFKRRLIRGAHIHWWLHNHRFRSRGNSRMGFDSVTEVQGCLVVLARHEYERARAEVQPIGGGRQRQVRAIRHDFNPHFRQLKRRGVRDDSHRDGRECYSTGRSRAGANNPLNENEWIGFRRVPDTSCSPRYTLGLFLNLKDSHSRTRNETNGTALIWEGRPAVTSTDIIDDRQVRANSGVFPDKKSILATQ